LNTADTAGIAVSKPATIPPVVKPDFKLSPAISSSGLFSAIPSDAVFPA